MNTSPHICPYNPMITSLRIPLVSSTYHYIIWLVYFLVILCFTQVMVSYIVDAVMYGYCNTQYRREIVRILRRACCIKGPCKNYVEPGRRNSDTRFTQADSTVIPNSCTNGSSHDCGVKGCTHNVIIQPTINENIIGENGDSTVIPNSEALQ